MTVSTYAIDDLGAPILAAPWPQASTAVRVFTTLVERIIGTRTGATSAQASGVDAIDLRSAAISVAPEFDLDIVPELEMGYRDAVQRGRALRWLGWGSDG